MKNVVSKYSNEQFTDRFFKYDVSKYRTNTAVPFDEQGLWWHFAEYEKPKFEIFDELDTIFRQVGEIDSDLADSFANEAKIEIECLFDEINERIQSLVNRYEYQYANDEDYVKERLRVLASRRKRNSKIAA